MAEKRWGARVFTEAEILARAIMITLHGDARRMVTCIGAECGDPHGPICINIDGPDGRYYINIGRTEERYQPSVYF